MLRILAIACTGSNWKKNLKDTKLFTPSPVSCSYFLYFDFAAIHTKSINSYIPG